MGKFLVGKNHNQQKDFTYETWEDLIERACDPVEVPKNLAPIMAPFDGKYKTKVVAMESQYNILVADVDEGDWSMEKVRGILKKYQLQSYIIIATVSHNTEGLGNRWRIFVELMESIPYHVWYMLQVALTSLFDGDACVLRAQQIAYLPNRGPGGYEYHVEEGAALDPYENLDLLVQLGFQLKAKHEKLEEKLRAKAKPIKARDLNLGEGQISPIAEFNKRFTITHMLETYNYDRRGRKWVHPESGSNTPGIVILDGKYYSHHQSDPLNDGHCHDSFDLYQEHSHKGDFQAALKEAANSITNSEGVTITKHNQRVYMSLDDDDEPVIFEDEPVILKKKKMGRPAEEKDTTTEEFLSLPTKNLNDFAHYFENCAIRTTRTGAVVGVIALASVVAGRVFYLVDMKNYSALDILLIAGTGSGKDLVRKGLQIILDVSGLEYLIGSSSYTSDAAIRSELVRGPTRVAVLDEFGDALLRSAQHDGSTPDMFAAIKEIYGTVADCWRAKGYSTGSSAADAEKHVPMHIHNPSLTIVGLSTPDQFLGSIQEGHREGGFLNRFIVIDGTNDVTQDNKQVMEPSDELLDRVRAARFLGCPMADDDDMINTDEDNSGWDTKSKAYPVFLEPDVLAVFEKFRVLMDPQSAPNAFTADMVVRCHENARRLALGLAVLDGGGSKPIVSKEIAIWSCRYIKHHCDRFMAKYKGHEDRATSNYGKHLEILEETIKEYGPEGMPKSKVARRKPCSGMKANDRKELLKDLVDQCRIYAEEILIEGSKKPTTFYTHEDFVEKD